MVALYITLGIIVLVAAILAMRVGISIVLEDELCVYLRVLLLKFRLYPAKKKRESTKKYKKKKVKKKKPSTVVRKSDTELKQKPPLNETIKTVTELLGVFSRAFAKHLHVRLAKIYIRIGTEDAAKTAILYGAVSGAVTCLIDTIDSITSISSLRCSEISVEPDFLSDRSVARLNISLSLSVFGALAVLLKTLFRYLKLKITKNRKEAD